MRLYHGSNIKIDKIDLNLSRPYKDFGRGFYLSADYQQALRMAENRTKLMLEGVPTITTFEFDEQLLEGTELKVKMWQDYCEEWALFVVQNRNKETAQPAHNYDIVYGPIADDSVTFQLRRYEAGGLTIEELIEGLRYAKGITFQYFFGTEEAIAHLTKVEQP